MKCPNCGKKMEYTERDYAPDTFDCECGEWIEAEMAFNEMKARAEKAEGELLSLKERLGVGDCGYCNEQKENEIKEIKKEEEAISEKLVKENQELGIKLAKVEGELKAIKARIEAVTEDEILDIIEEQDEKYMNCLTADEYIAKAVIEKIKQIGGEK